jgi:hypothetical protein
MRPQHLDPDWLACCMLLQVEFLKQVVRGLLPPQPPAPPGQPPAPVTPSDAAAKVLLQLMQQHLQAQQGAT